MSDTYNLYNLEAPFKEYLVAGNQKPVSVKNYMSDFRHFAGWMILKLKVKSEKLKVETMNGIDFTQQIDHGLVEEYKSYLSENNIPHKTINRRLSTVRKFCSFCISQGWLKENPAKKVGNVGGVGDGLLDQFRSDLEKEKLDQSVITSYLDDIRDFLKV